MRNTDITALPPAELQEGAGGTEHLTSGAQRSPHDPLGHSFLLALLAAFSAPRLILEKHPQCCGLGLFFPCFRLFLRSFLPRNHSKKAAESLSQVHSHSLLKRPSPEQ